MGKGEPTQYKIESAPLGKNKFEVSRFDLVFKDQDII